MSIKVCIIEDHADFREALGQVIRSTEGFSLAGKFGSAEEGLLHLPKCDVILLDIGLPGRSGIEAIPDLREKLPNAEIVIMTVFEDDRNIFRAVLAGANGYLLKKTPPERIITGIREAVSGGMPMTPSIARRAFDLLKKYAPEPEGENSITPREQEVLSLLVEGCNYKLISERLSISIDTVRNHIKSIYRKLQVHSKSQAVAKAIREGLV